MWKSAFMRRVLRRLERLSPFGKHWPGHFYSPVPTRGDVLKGIQAKKAARKITEINFRMDEQMLRLSGYESLFDQFPFTKAPCPEHRFYLDNDYFTWLDALFLFCFLCREKPRRIVEVGSGFSSALMLDVRDRFLTPSPEMTFIEPRPKVLKKLFRSEDLKQHRFIQAPVQQAGFEVFDALEAGDLLFVDSSHVVKYGSDVNYLFFEVMPRLRSGVFVHFHDVFENFEYPDAWLVQGRYWNESYFLRAFLSGNNEWEIVFFNNVMARRHDARIREKLPEFAGKGACSLYLRKK